MSLERSLEEAVQTINILVKSVDLLSAQIADLNAQPQILASHSTSEIMTEQAEVAKPTQTKPLAAAKEEVQQEAPISDDTIKASEQFAKVIKAMGEFNSVALQRNGGDKDAAREATIAIMKQYTPDGKAVTFVRGLFEAENTGAESADILQDLLDAYNNSIAELNATSEAVATDDFDDKDEVEITAEDIKKALREYAAIEGKPAAIAMLAEVSGSKTVAGVKEADYAKVLAALTK